MCHSVPGGSLIAAPDPLTIELGDNGLLTFHITDLGGSENTLISVQGLDKLVLDATVGAGGDNWTFVNGSNGKSYISDNITSPGPYTLDVSIGATAISGDYPIVVMYAGNGLRGTEIGFTLRIVSEPPVLTIVTAGVGFASISWTPNNANSVLQENLTLLPANWTNSPSGSTNPIVVSTALPTKFYRVVSP